MLCVCVYYTSNRYNKYNSHGVAWNYYLVSTNNYWANILNNFANYSY